MGASWPGRTGRGALLQGGRKGERPGCASGVLSAQRPCAEDCFVLLLACRHATPAFAQCPHGPLPACASLVRLQAASRCSS